MKAPAEPTWIETPNGYALTIANDQIQARNAEGKVLKSVPAAVKKTEEFLELDNLLNWLKSHDDQCGAQVETWVLRSLPVPAAVIAAVWPDETWRSWLHDLVIQPATSADAGEANGSVLAGFLRDASTGENGKAQLVIVDLAGETHTIDAAEILIPHPVLLDNLGELRDFATDSGVQQRFSQLQREAYALPDPLPDGAVTALRTWEDAYFEEVRIAMGKARSLGYGIKGDYAVTSIYEDGRVVEANYWLGEEEYPEVETYTGTLSWEIDGEIVPVRELGPVAYSEGVRMATQIYAVRTIEEDDDE